MNPFAQHPAVWRRALILLMAFVLLALLAAAEDLHQALLEVLVVTEQVISRHPWLGATLFVAFAAISAMLAFVSIAILVPAAVFTWGEPLSIALLWLGWILGGAATYSIGRFLGRPVVRRLTAQQAVEKIEHRVRRDAPFWLVLILQLALPSEIPGYVLGLARYSLPRYLLALALAELPYTVATVYVGTSFVARRGVALLAAGIAITALSVAMFYVLRRVMRPQRG